MVKGFGQNDSKIAEYASKTFKPEDSVLAEIRTRCAKEGLPEIQVGGMDVLHLEILTRAIGAKTAVEIGTLGGYSGVSILRGLGKTGKLYTCELDAHHAEVARESFSKAGYGAQAEVLVGPALETLTTLNGLGPFDLVFIDADKENYPHYLKWASENLRQGGVVLADNTFGWGMIADSSFESDEEKRAIQGLQLFNDSIANGKKFRSTILPTAEGLTVGVKL